MTDALTAELSRLDELLTQYPFAQSRLRPPAPEGAVDEVAGRIGIAAPNTVRKLYAWRDGASQAGGWPLFLFPTFYQFLTLKEVEEQAAWPISWSADVGVAGFPFAMDMSGRFLVAQSGEDDVVLRVSSDHVGPAEPESSLLGLILLSCQALTGEHEEFVLSFADDRMSWTTPDEKGLL
ncbi:hypothetical protein [Kribbella sp. NBC_00889]|uniref:hypothetical protein n=1 Tax=Kribbella sp. NBC_00889 TaxID=2975974 RepID=UPI00386B713B|nr:hypothetical protein OG817_31610 [Kribbella sp. NBC_00889]